MRISYELDLPTRTVEEIGQLQVGLDLVARGYQVFRAMTTANTCQFVILQGQSVVRVEVRTVSPRNGRTYYKKVTGRVYDVLATITPDGIIYDPSLPF